MDDTRARMRSAMQANASQNSALASGMRANASQNSALASAMRASASQNSALASGMRANASQNSALASAMRATASQSSASKASGMRATAMRATAVHVLVLVALLGQCAGGKPMSETLQRALSAGRGPSPGAKKLLNIPDDGGYEANPILCTKSLNFREYFEIKSQKLENIAELRQKLVECYLTHKKPPVLDEVLNFIQPRPIYRKDDDKYMHLLAQMGFVWRNIPGSSKAIFVEKYEKIANRLRYLMNMKEYRQNNRHIIYLDDVTHLYGDKSFIAISNRHGILSFVTHFQSGKPIFEKKNTREVYYEKYQEAAKQPFMQKEFLSTKSVISYQQSSLNAEQTRYTDHIEWIQGVVLKKLSEACVFVYEDSPSADFSPYSSKEKMKDYLVNNDIPCSENAHRFHMYELIKKFLKSKVDDFSLILSSLGHEVLLRPNNFEILNFYNYFWGKSLTDLELNTILDIERSLVKVEDTVYTEDRMMEVVIDKIMTLGKYEGVADDNLTEYASVVKYDCEYGIATMFVD